MPIVNLEIDRLQHNELHNLQMQILLGVSKRNAYLRFSPLLVQISNYEIFKKLNFFIKQFLENILKLFLISQIGNNLRL